MVPRFLVPLGLALAVPALVILGMVDPGSSNLFPRCLFHELTGLQCFGCGGQRAVHALAQGNLAQALTLNALVVFLLPFLVYSWVKEVGRRTLGWRARDIHIASAWIWALVGVMVAFVVIRNLALGTIPWVAP